MQQNTATLYEAATDTSCDELDLVNSALNSQFSASSEANENTRAAASRVQGEQTWLSALTDLNPWLKVKTF